MAGIRLLDCSGGAIGSLGSGLRVPTVTEKVVLKPYDPAWPHRFESEKIVLAEIFAGCDAAIEHVGSTAVPGLGAKPIIDVIVGVRRLADVERRIEALEEAGYEYVPQYEGELPERRYFRKPRRGERLFHLHCVIEGRGFWERHLAFRDYLRAHPETAAEYERLKRELAARVPKHEYTQAKSPFIEAVLAAARDGS